MHIGNVMLRNGIYNDVCQVKMFTALNQHHPTPPSYRMKTWPRGKQEDGWRAFHRPVLWREIGEIVTPGVNFDNFKVDSGCQFSNWNMKTKIKEIIKLHVWNHNVG